MVRSAPHRLLWSGALAVSLMGVSGLTGCTRTGEFQAISMWNQSRIKPMEESPSPGWQSSARQIPPGTVARGELPPDSPVASGRVNGDLVRDIPIPVTRQLLARGQERYNIYCAPCHGRLGDGEGMIVKRGFPPPPDYAIPRLRNAPVGHFFDVITHGYGVMYSYASRVTEEDRWAISAYIRVLQAARPVVPVERGREERIRARQRGIGVQPVGPEPGAGTPAPPGGGAPAPNRTPPAGEPGAPGGPQTPGAGHQAPGVGS